MDSNESDVPSLLANVQSNVAGFDITPSPRAETPSSRVPPLDGVQRRSDAIAVASPDSPFQASTLHPMHSVSISMPVSPTGFGIARSEEVELRRQAIANASHGMPRPPRKPNAVKFEQPDKPMFHSQPIPGTLPHAKTTQVYDSAMPSLPRMTRSKGLRDRRYDSFKTWSGKLERQITNLRGKQQEPEESDGSRDRPTSSMPKVDRFFAALEGPELDKLRSSEELILPSDKTWPFLLRFPVSAFGMCLGVSSQAILWKTIATSASMRFLHISLKINLVLWCISIALMCILSAIYACKIIFFFEAVRREYYHPIRVNFFFAPWIACLFLAIGVPPSVATDLHHVLWYVLMAPILCLELKIYGQWMSGGQRRLSKVANPSNHLSIVGNFVGALLGASMGLKEGPIFFFAVGLAHYTVLFVTLYQRLPTNETLPKELHPVFFLFVAAPSVACMAWAKITGEFGFGSRVAYFIAMFLYASLAVRINFFRGFRFSLAWWAYTFPMTGAAIATIRYSSEVKNHFTQTLCVGLSMLATLTVTALLVTTMLHAFVLRDLFPNDISIAITERKLKPIMELHEKRTESSETKDLEACTSVDPEGH